MRSAAAFVVLALLGGAVGAQQPAPPAPTVTLHGVVTTANDVPLPRVRVAMTGTATVDIITPGVLTDASGRFTMRVPAIGASRVSFTKAGYVPQTTELTRSQLTAQTQELRVRLARGGAIGGQVLDRSGGVMMGSVTARRVGAPAAEALLTTTTNDLGEFRFGGLADGQYAITVRPSALALSGPPAEREALLKKFEVQAATVSVTAGVEVGNLRITIETPSELPQTADPPAPDPAATASLSGRVVSANGTPVAGALVRAYRPFVAGRAVETDERGRYVIDRLTPGEYTVEARKYGFVNRQYGQAGTAATGRSVSLRDGQTANAIDITLTRGSAIAGTIVDEFGEPVQGVEVSALQIQMIAGRRRALRVSSLGSYRTDDRGQYRLSFLAPGTYVVQARVRDAVSGGSGYVPLYFPGALNVDQATPMQVEIGATASAVDFTLTLSGTHKIAGTLFDVAGKPTGRAQVLLAVSERSGATQLEPTTASAGEDGTFVFPNVPPGDYVLQAIGGLTERDSSGVFRVTSRSFASSFVTVTAEDPPPVQLRLSAGATLRGRISYEGLAEAPARAASLLAFPADFDRGPMIGAGPVGFTLNPDNSFQYTGVFGPTLIRVEPRQSDWYVKSVMFNGQDLADTPFDFGLDGTFSDIEVVVATTGATVMGRVTDDRAAPVADYGVHVFSTFRDRWFTGSRWVKTARPTQDGSFRVDGLPPGDYWVAAIGRIEGTPGGGVLPPDPQLLESLSSRATRITLGEGQSRDLMLRLTPR